MNHPGALLGAEPDRVPIAVDSLADYVARLRQVTTRIRELTIQADAIKAAIQDAMGEAEIGTVHGRAVVTWTQHVRHAFDQTAFKNTQPDVYATYLKATPYRRFTLIENEDDDEQ